MMKFDRDAWVQLVVSIEPTHALTLGAGSEIELPRFQRRSEHFLNKVRRRALGRRWHWDTAEANQLRALCFIEHIDSNLHNQSSVHAEGKVAEVLMEEGQSIWHSVQPLGHFHCEEIRDVQAHSRYVTKELRRPEAVEHALAYLPRPPGERAQRAASARAFARQRE